MHDDRATGHVYFLALVAPPATHDRGRGVPREVVLLVDHSGSMQGAKWQAADWAVERFLSDLTERDACSLGLFHNTTRWLADKPFRAGLSEVAEATQFLKDHRDSGGTELGVALEQALSQERLKGDYTRHVLLLTDAEVSDAGRILRLAGEEAARTDRRRISVLCIDAAPNALLATELAERGGGLSRFLTSQPEEEDITTALDEILADWAEPVLAGLRLEVNRANAEAAGRAVAKGDKGWCTLDIGDLPAGRAVWVAGRVPRDDCGTLSFRLRAARGGPLAECRLDLPEEGDSRPALKALFGARRVRGLEWLIHSGYSPEELADHLRRLGYDPETLTGGSGKKKVYAENNRKDVETALKGLLVREALDYGLASSETAFVAVRSEAGKPVQETVVVANALPAGWADREHLLCARFGSGAPAPLGVARMAAPPAPTGGRVRMSKQKRQAPAADLSMMSLDSCPPLETRSTVDREPTAVFEGIPSLTAGEALLFDSTRPADATRLPDRATLDRLRVTFPKGDPVPGSVDGVWLLLYVDDLAAPRARVRLADLLRQHGERPLNVLRKASQVVRLVLTDPDGAWAKAPPRMQVALGWSTSS